MCHLIKYILDTMDYNFLRDVEGDRKFFGTIILFSVNLVFGVWNPQYLPLAAVGKTRKSPEIIWKGCLKMVEIINTDQGR